MYHNQNIHHNSQTGNKTASMQWISSARRCFTWLLPYHDSSHLWINPFSNTLSPYSKYTFNNSRVAIGPAVHSTCKGSSLKRTHHMTEWETVSHTWNKKSIFLVCIIHITHKPILASRSFVFKAYENKAPNSVSKFTIQLAEKLNLNHIKNSDTNLVFILILTNTPFSKIFPLDCILYSRQKYSIFLYIIIFILQPQYMYLNNSET